MKTTKLFAVSLASWVLLGAAVSAGAAPVVEQTGKTPTEVNIIEDDIDPIDPTNPNQKHLTLEKVPAGYSFESTLQNKSYALTANLTDTIDVFNDLSKREWSVKASVVNGLTKGDDQFEVSQFKINDVELVGTGANGIVAKSGALDRTNTGLIKTNVTKVNINFTDTNTVLKVGDKLTGKISYQLYNTATAQ